MPTSVNSQLNNLIAEFIGEATDKRVIHWSWILRSTIKPLSSSSNSFTKDINFYVGDGKLIEFWFDIWIGSTLLKLAFPRIFALAGKKEGNIHEFGSRVATIGSGLFPSEGLYLTGNSKSGMTFSKL
ncbi:hypothetical protein GOBAR_DD16009 [Gossypium barbadense]|nr:hypothetical protein GOBAR_DD16009 [Gossypium barbadense]